MKYILSSRQTSGSLLQDCEPSKVSNACGRCTCHLELLQRDESCPEQALALTLPSYLDLRTGQKCLQLPPARQASQVEQAARAEQQEPLLRRFLLLWLVRHRVPAHRDRMIFGSSTQKAVRTNKSAPGLQEHWEKRVEAPAFVEIWQGHLSFEPLAVCDQSHTCLYRTESRLPTPLGRQSRTVGRALTLCW